MNAVELIKLNEGFRDKVYTCTADKLTIGYGTNLEDRGLSEKEAEMLLLNDMEDITAFLKDFGLLGFMGEAREAVCVDMCYQMGVAGFCKFKRMIEHLRVQAYNSAAHELLDSRYARQTPGRAERNAEILRKGDYS